VNELALFSGTGGGILGGKLLGWRTVCAVEIEPYCREVLLRRQRDGVLPMFPIWDDVKTFAGKPLRGLVDVVTAGFPCQPWSEGGKKLGEKDERNLWPETIRIIREVRPSFVFLENVSGLLTHKYFGRILGDLAESGLDCRWDCIPASAVGAPHERDRVWIAASNAKRERRQRLWEHLPRAFGRHEFERLVQQEISVCVPAGKAGRISDGITHRLDRLRAIGNGQVPLVAATAWEALT
jgi:DNA (cytosine-5)-methyltransferase 1